NEASATALTGGKFNETHANRVLKGPELAGILKGENAKDLVDNFEFVYVAGHKNRELTMFHPESKTLFEADFLFNIKSKSELYGKVNPTKGLGFFARYLQPYSAVGKWLSGRLLSSAEQGNRDAISAIASWDFERIVMCHGEVIEGKNESRLAFDSVYGHFYK
ncbi:hypothetical protein BABINDRAFT_7623, partial [Babjeviella inositovora NRRL Y-12698]